MKRNKMLLVVFNDSNIQHGWECSDASCDSLTRARAIGYLKSEDDEQITLTMAIGDFGLIFEKLTIPRGAICSVKELRIK